MSGRRAQGSLLPDDEWLRLFQSVPDDSLASITLLSIFLPIDTFFRKMIVRGVERPIVAAKH
jgi:hypothetical protein